MNAPSPRDALARPLRDLRLSVIEACNFRCPYCMPAERIADRVLELSLPEVSTGESA